MMLSGQVHDMNDVEFYRKALMTLYNQEEGSEGKEDVVSREERIQAQETLMEFAIQSIFPRETTTVNFLELNDIVMQSLLTNLNIALVDMPEVLLRMKVANNHSLHEL